MPLFKKIKNAWNVFKNRDPTSDRFSYSLGQSYSYRPDRIMFSSRNERSIINSIYNRISMDVAAVDIRHVILDDNGCFKEEIDSYLNRCLSLEANVDQTGRSLIQDVVMSMLDEGCVAIVPTSLDLEKNGIKDIYSLRTGKILEWYPKHVKLKVYNETTGEKEEIILPKNQIAIIENPLYAVMNEPNSTMQRLIRKLSLLDMTDEKNNSGRLDLIIQLPYSVKSELRRQQAELRRKDIENQLSNGKYGLAYVDSAEKITQLNRPIDNNLMSQVDYLTKMLFSQLGITQSILDGTADEKTMLNYYDRSIEPIVSAIIDEMVRKFLTDEARSKKQSIYYFKDVFKMVTIAEITELGEKFTRNEILSSNEIRQIIGFKPSDNPEADELRNKNLNKSDEEVRYDLMQRNPEMKKYLDKPFDKDDPKKKEFIEKKQKIERNMKDEK